MIRRLPIAPAPLPLTRGECAQGERPCPHTTCRHAVPPTPGDLRRRTWFCALDGAEIAEVFGGLAPGDAAWLLGMDHSYLARVERAALARMRRRLEIVTPPVDSCLRISDPAVERRRVA